MGNLPISKALQFLLCSDLMSFCPQVPGNSVNQTILPGTTAGVGAELTNEMSSKAPSVLPSEYVSHCERIAGLEYLQDPSTSAQLVLHLPGPSYNNAPRGEPTFWLQHNELLTEMSADFQPSLMQDLPPKQPDVKTTIRSKLEQKIGQTAVEEMKHEFLACPLIDNPAPEVSCNRTGLKYFAIA